MKIKLLLIAITISLSGAGALMPVAYGATVEELQAQISALLAQIQALQAQLSSAGGTTVSSGTVPASLLTSGDLTLGSKGAAVKDLQMFLNANGYPVAASGVGSLGNESDYFGSLTKTALAKWQSANGIFPASGYFGPVTRTKLASMSTTTGGTTTGGIVPAPAPVPEETVPDTVIPAEPAPVETLPNPFVSSLKIEVIYPSITLSSYGYKTLNGLRFSASEKVAITKIRFKNNGDFNDAYIKDLELLDATDAVLAKAEGLTNQSVEFLMIADAGKKNKGLVVSGNDYYINATLLTPSYGGEKPKIRLDIESVSDISAFDYDDLTRVADISESVVFPVQGPTISAF